MNQKAPMIYKVIKNIAYIVALILCIVLLGLWKGLLLDLILVMFGWALNLEAMIRNIES